MDAKLLKGQEQSKQSQNKELEAIAGGRINDLVKNLSLRGKVARWAAMAAMAASVVGGISISMPMPAEALNRVHGSYESRYFRVSRVSQNNNGNNPMMFANAGNEKVHIAGVSWVSSGNNAGYIETNKGKFYFGKRIILNFFDSGFGTVTITRIVIY